MANGLDSTGLPQTFQPTAVLAQPVALCACRRGCLSRSLLIYEFPSGSLVVLTNEPCLLMRPRRAAQSQARRQDIACTVTALLSPARPLHILTDRGKPYHADQAARPSIAVAAARRSILPSGSRGTASTAKSRSGSL
jgi:hypothetical protein